MFPQYLNRIVIMDGYIVNIIMVTVYCLRKENTPSRFTFMTFLLQRTQGSKRSWMFSKSII